MDVLRSEDDGDSWKWKTPAVSLARFAGCAGFTAHSFALRACSSSVVAVLPPRVTRPFRAGRCGGARRGRGCSPPSAPPAGGAGRLEGRPGARRPGRGFPVRGWSGGGGGCSVLATLPYNDLGGMTMGTRVEEYYEAEIRKLSTAERLRLVELIRRDLWGGADQGGRRSILELRGLGAKIWRGVDAQAYVDELRNEWKSNR